MAVQSMNGFMLSGRKLKVGPAAKGSVLPPQMIAVLEQGEAASAPAAASTAAAGAEPSLSKEESVTISSAAMRLQIMQNMAASQSAGPATNAWADSV